MMAAVILHPAAFIRGVIESAGSVGMTYGPPDSRRSVAYDYGRSVGCRIRGFE
jgi:hypothetical protein